MGVRNGILFGNSVLGFMASHLLRPEHGKGQTCRYGPFRRDNKTCSRWNQCSKVVGLLPRTTGRAHPTETRTRLAIAGAWNDPMRLSLGREKYQCDL